MAKKRAQLVGNKFTLGDIDTTLWQIEEHLSNGEYKDAKRLVTNARNRLDIIRGVAPKGRGNDSQKRRCSFRTFLCQPSRRNWVRIFLIESFSDRALRVGRTVR
ncbi:MAG: hypothetical protein P8J32_05380 [bacterium]|nr:hypothetical protein [bacterium]